jgi:hypothetical protein
MFENHGHGEVDKGAQSRAEGAALPGVELIATERRRQIEVEGWTPEHDDEHDSAQLAMAGAAYATAARAVVHTLQYCRGRGREHAERQSDPAERERLLQLCAEDEADPLNNYYGRNDDGSVRPPRFDWPWDASWWKPSNDPVRNLVKAGALIAAEIDRLQRAAASTDESPRPDEPCSSHT